MDSSKNGLLVVRIRVAARKSLRRKQDEGGVGPHGPQVYTVYTELLFEW